MSEPRRQVTAIVTDLLFATRIAQTARRLGVQLLVVRPQEALERCRAVPPRVVVLDLESAPDAPDLIRELKRDPATAAVPVIGFYPHVRQGLRRAALEAGLDQAMPRSVFVARLPELLRGAPPTAA